MTRTLRQAFIPTLSRLHDLTDGQAKPIPALAFHSQLLTARFGQRVVLRSAVVFRLTPFRLDPAAVLQPIKSRVERAFSHAQDVIGELLDALSNAKPVHRSVVEDFQNQHIQGALEEFTFLHSSTK